MNASVATGFVAGTVVHTPNGLVPISRLRVGDLVLASPDVDEPATPHRICATQVSEPQAVCLLQFVVEPHIHSLVLGPGQPFWMHHGGWSTVADAEGSFLRHLTGDDEAWVLRALRIFETEQADVGWTFQNDAFSGPTIDLRDGAVKVPRSFAEETFDEWASSHTVDFRAPVHRVTVEGARTLFVGEVGIWMRDAGPHQSS